MPLKKIAEAEKAIAFFPGWSDPDPHDGYTRFSTPISIGGVTVAGLFLTGGTYAQYPDRHVSFELAISQAGGRRRTRLMRLDWRDIKGGHTNRRSCPSGCPGRTEATHFHSFDLNWSKAEQRMRSKKLRCACNVPEQLQSFEELRNHVGKLFRINNIAIVTPPKWTYDLFPNDVATDDTE